MNAARSFKEFHEASFMRSEDQLKAEKLSEEFFADFIHYTPIQIELLELYLNAGQIDLFYKSLADLKYLIEFSDNFSRYWHVLRGYSGALSKLKALKSVNGLKKIYRYYIGRYGDRRQLRNEHWFEKKRWEFLDELQRIHTEDDLGNFTFKYQRILSENFDIYKSFMVAFIHDLKKLLPVSEEFIKVKND